MPAESPNNGFPLVGRVGLAVLGTALIWPTLALPLAIGCLVALAGAGRLVSSADNAEPIPAPTRDRNRRRDSRVTDGRVERNRISSAGRPFGSE